VKPDEIRRKRWVFGGKQDALYLGSMLPGCYLWTQNPDLAFVSIASFTIT
jgi:hypothetical protein